MRKIVLFVLTAILTSLASGCIANEFYNITEIREMANEKWNGEYVDKCGRTIDVSAEIQIFGENAPVIKIKYANYSIDRDSYPAEAKIREDKQHLSISVNNPWKTVASGSLKKHEKKKTLYRGYFENVEYTLERENMPRAYDRLYNLMSMLNMEQDDYMSELPRRIEILCKADSETGQKKTDEFLNVEIMRNIDGIPILTHASSSFKRRGWPCYTPMIDYSIKQEDEYQIIIYDIEEVDRIADDIPLCSVGSVIKSIEKEIKAGHIRKVFELQFGFAVYNDPEFKGDSNEDAEFYYLVPSWVVNCIYIENPKEKYFFDGEDGQDERASDNYKSIVINAQNGKMLDYFDKSKLGWGDADYKGFISWDNIKTE